MFEIKNLRISKIEKMQISKRGLELSLTHFLIYYRYNRLLKVMRMHFYFTNYNFFIFIFFFLNNHSQANFQSNEDKAIPKA